MPRHLLDNTFIKTLRLSSKCYIKISCDAWPKKGEYSNFTICLSHTKSVWGISHILHANYLEIVQIFLLWQNAWRCASTFVDSSWNSVTSPNILLPHWLIVSPMNWGNMIHCFNQNTARELFPGKTVSSF